MAAKSKIIFMLALVIIAVGLILNTAGCSSEEANSPVMKAERTEQYGQYSPTNKETHVLLVVQVEENYGATLDNAKLNADGQVFEFFLMDYQISGDAVSSRTYVATVPKDILEFDLVVTGQETVKFKAENEISESYF